MIQAPLRFGTPEYLWFLVLPLGAYALTLWWMLWRARARERFGGLRREQGGASYAAPAAVLLAIALAVFAAARPQWGSHDVRVEQRGIDSVIVLDVSNSMLADDAQPSRLARSQSEVDALLDRMQGDQVGLVIFAGDAFVRSPLTSDRRAVRRIIDTIGADRALVTPGSDVGAGIRAGQRVLSKGTAKTRTMVIVSDGEDHAARIDAAVAGATAAGIRIYTAGAGTAAGAAIVDVNPATQQPRARVDANGRPVITRLNEQTLTSIAAAGGGRYIPLSGDGRPLTGLAAEFAGLERTPFGTATSFVKVERFQIFAAVALVLAAGALVVPPLVGDGRGGLRAGMRLWPLAGAGMLVAGICSTSVGEINRQGNGQYAVGNYGGALNLYRTAEARDPSRDEIKHNAGNALDQQGDYAQAIDETERGLPAQGDLAAKLQYALGNHYAGARKLLDAVEAYKRALLADPGDQDAKHNLEIVSARLTPSPSPAPTPRPDESPTPGDADGTPDANATASGARPGETPGAGPTSSGNVPGTPQPGDRGQPGEPQLSQQELQQRLEDALRGIDQQFSEEDAMRALQLLDELNRRNVQQAQPGGAGGGVPDY